MTVAATKTAHGVTLTPAAAAKVKELLAREADENLKLRLAVEAGGCAGMMYDLGFDSTVLEGDSIVLFDGVPLIVDQLSAPLVDGAVIDFEDTISSQGFSIDNPNAQRGCACGNSFC
ncbi:MAG: iron-sulfur cluster assembly accessory protein [Bifidobacteriaceae bacterium]|jgi:iron-sulfur cluster assembly accessory protein|nr:iron-sulfur cluster assembly accessory protein [Bifidobacteriaceae bacterium]